MRERRSWKCLNELVNFRNQYDCEIIDYNRDETFTRETRMIQNQA